MEHLDNIRWTQIKNHCSKAFRKFVLTVFILYLLLSWHSAFCEDE